ncbi:hypothetical protein E2C01_078417 [Portunus trituberculatus]|uniref:Uncharacterized protein n=1 Tax=Portunus trituberculatus TaxID=210409 RepID=A0A5B7IIP7_PORTR|nr:hypothetical protein [Portunus trituberculatus]
MHAGLPHEPLEAASRLSRPLIWDIKAAHNQDYSAAIAGHHLPVAWNTPFLPRYVYNICWRNNLRDNTVLNNVCFMRNSAPWKYIIKNFPRSFLLIGRTVRQARRYKTYTTTQANNSPLKGLPHAMPLPLPRQC